MPFLPVIKHGDGDGDNNNNDVEKAENIDVNWFGEKSKEYNIYVGGRNESQAKLQKVTTLYDIMVHPAGDKVVHLFKREPQQPKGKPRAPKGSDADGRSKTIQTWLGSNGVQNIYLTTLIEAVKTRKGHISSLAQTCLAEIKDHCLRRVKAGADPSQEFLLLVDTSSDSYYVYVDYRFIVAHSGKGPNVQKKMLEEGIGVEKYYTLSSICNGALEGFTSPNSNHPWVAFKYQELLTWAFPDVFLLEELLCNQETIPDKIIVDASNWKTLLWAAVMGLAECARHPEWYYMGLMVLDLVQSGPCTSTVSVMTAG
jgi:hypothetical protein